MMTTDAKKPTIAILMNSFWNSGEGISGGDVRLIQVFERIEETFAAIDIYTSEQSRKIIGNRIKKANFIISDQKYDKGSLFKAYFSREKWAKKEILKHKYDIVYASSDFFTDVNPCHVYKKKYPDIRWIQCIFHVYPDWKKRPGNKIVNLAGSLIQNRSFVKIKRKADAIININSQVRDCLIQKMKFNKNLIHLNPCGADLNYFKKLKVEKKLNQAAFLARLKPSKGIFELVEIWKGVTKTVPSAKLMIIGGGSPETKEKLQGSIDAAKLHNNIFLNGFMDQEEAFKIVKESQVFVFPSHEEGFGMAIAEAMACEVPAVAWNLEVYGEVFPKGLVQVKENNTASFAKEVIKLFKDDKYSRRMSLDAKEMVQKYGLDEIAQEEKKIIFNQS